MTLFSLFLYTVLHYRHFYYKLWKESIFEVNIDLDWLEIIKPYIYKSLFYSKTLLIKEWNQLKNKQDENTIIEEEEQEKSDEEEINTIEDKQSFYDKSEIHQNDNNDEEEYINSLDMDEISFSFSKEGEEEKY